MSSSIIKLNYNLTFNHNALSLLELYGDLYPHMILFSIIMAFQAMVIYYLIILSCFSSGSVEDHFHSEIIPFVRDITLHYAE